MSRKKIILLIVLAVILGGAGYGYSEYTRKIKDLTHVKAHVKMQASDLIQAFEKNETDANAKYLDKVIAVSGTIKIIEKGDNGYYSVVLGENNKLSSVRCSMDSTHQQDIASLPPGTLVTIKGACTGFNADELLGSDVVLNRSVVQK